MVNVFEILVKQFLNHKIQMVMMVFVILIIHQGTIVSDLPLGNMVK